MNQNASRPEAHWFQRPPHRVHVMGDDELAESVAREFVDLIRKRLDCNSYAVITTSVGRTLRPAYSILRTAYKMAVDWTRVICVQMDEYADIGNTDSRSTAFELMHELIGPLGIGRFIQFYDSSGASPISLDNFELQIRTLGGLDCAVHGVGQNGHIGLNEPDVTEGLRTRVVVLSESTRLANSVRFRNGVTLGLQVLSEARVSILALRGTHKQNAARSLLFDSSGSQNPVAHLRTCGQVSIYLDHEAAPEGLYSISGVQWSPKS